MRDLAGAISRHPWYGIADRAIAVPNVLTIAAHPPAGVAKTAAKAGLAEATLLAFSACGGKETCINDIF